MEQSNNMNNQGLGNVMQTFSEIPNANSNAKRIVGLVKESGAVTGYKLSSGETISKYDAVEMARDGGIAGVGVAKNGDTEYLRSLPDETEDNNLSNLPTVTE